jgi:hypothetical protein
VFNKPILLFIKTFTVRGLWGSVVVKALRYESEDLGIDPQWCRWGFFSETTDETMCPGVDSASKNEYQDTPVGKDGRCVMVTTLPPSLCRKSRKSGALTYRIPKGLFRPVVGRLYLYLYLLLYDGDRLLHRRL